MEISKEALIDLYREAYIAGYNDRDSCIFGNGPATGDSITRLEAAILLLPLLKKTKEDVQKN